MSFASFVVMYTIEFQKRSLPHAHLLIFLHPNSKYPTPGDIDKVISAEILCPINNPELHKCVQDHIIHGPCGMSNKSLPCMKYRKCSRLFPKKIQRTTTISENGFPHYCRRNDSLTVTKNGVCLDNRSVVPYNPQLLLKYQTYINVEWCNRSTSIKYLFKYINKGYDIITTVIVLEQNEFFLNKEPIDEIKQYLDCRYVSLISLSLGDQITTTLATSVLQVSSEQNS